VKELALVKELCYIIVGQPAENTLNTVLYLITHGHQHYADFEVSFFISWWVVRIPFRYHSQCQGFAGTLASVTGNADTLQVS